MGCGRGLLQTLVVADNPQPAAVPDEPVLIGEERS